MIDLRSDTQTKPSPGMREAMANAEVGDEQRREDPTVLALEKRAALFLGQAEAVYLPTATMANQIALAILGERGTELIVEETAHIMVSELGGAAVHAGLQTRGLPGYRGRISPSSRCAPGDRSMMVSFSISQSASDRRALENTHNSAGAERCGPSRSCTRLSRLRGSSSFACISTVRALGERVGGDVA